MKIGKMFLKIILKLVKKKVPKFISFQSAKYKTSLCMRIIFLQHYLRKKYLLLNPSPIHQTFI